MRYGMALLVLMIGAFLVGCTYGGEQGIETDDNMTGVGDMNDGTAGGMNDGTVTDEPVGTDMPGEDEIGDGEIEDPEDGMY